MCTDGLNVQTEVHWRETSSQTNLPSRKLMTLMQQIERSWNQSKPNLWSFLTNKHYCTSTGQWLKKTQEDMRWDTPKETSPLCFMTWWQHADGYRTFTLTWMIHQCNTYTNSSIEWRLAKENKAQAAGRQEWAVETAKLYRRRYRGKSERRCNIPNLLFNFTMMCSLHDDTEACLEEASASLSRQLQSVSSICISYPSISQCWKDTPEHDHLHESVTHPEDTHTPVTHPQDDTHNTSAHRNTLHISNRNNFAENFPFDLPQPPAYHCTSTSMLDQLTQRLQKSRRKLQAVAEDSQWANYHQLTQDIATLQADEAHFRLEMVSYQTTNNCLQSDRTVKVLTALRTIQHHINRTYQFLTVNGNCHLHYAKDSLSLFEEGLTLQVQQHQHGLATWLPVSFKHHFQCSF